MKSSAADFKQQLEQLQAEHASSSLQLETELKQQLTDVQQRYSADVQVSHKSRTALSPVTHRSVFATSCDNIGLF